MRVYRLILGRVWEVGWHPLAEVEDCVQRRDRVTETEREEEEEEQGSPPSSSSDTSDIVG